MYVVPNGEERLVAVEDLFFSTTDVKGVIDGANTVFSTYACYTFDELLGQPHNLIRHPYMPGGAFHATWAALLAGHPVGAYVKNLAQDGAAYWVFATITPLGDRFLSVRQRPCREDLFAATRGLYEQVLPMEQAARSAGASRAAAAALGAEAVVEGVQGLGFSDFLGYVRAVVPAEITARRALVHWTDPDPRDGLHPLTQRLVAAAVGVDEALRGQLARLDRLGELSAQLADLSERTEVGVERLEAAVAAAVSASTEVASTEPVLARVVGPLAAISQWLCEAIDDLHQRLDGVHGQVDELRLRVALALLQDEQLAEFAREVGAGTGPVGAGQYVQDLCVALESAATTAGREVLTTNERLRTLAQDLIEVEREMRSFQRQLSTWRLLIPRYRLSQRLDPYTEPIDAQLRVGLHQIAEFRHLADRCVTDAEPFDAQRVTDAVSAVVAARRDVEAATTPVAETSIRPVRGRVPVALAPQPTVGATSDEVTADAQALSPGSGSAR